MSSSPNNLSVYWLHPLPRRSSLQKSSTIKADMSGQAGSCSRYDSSINFKYLDPYLLDQEDASSM
jgi:hypothetical protein